MTFTIATFFSFYVFVANSLDAQLTAHCDNSLTVTRNGVVIGYETDWHNAFSRTLVDVVGTDVLQFICQDDGLTVGGFIATITIDGYSFPTTNPITAGYFRVVSSSDNYTSSLTYSPKTSGPWDRDTAGIADNAFWIWNGRLGNTMIFEISVPTAEPTGAPSKPTANPSKPTANPSEPTANPSEPTANPSACFNAMDSWTVEPIGDSTQFRFRVDCGDGDQFLKIKMESLIEYDTTDKATQNKISAFASQDYYWVTDHDDQFQGLAAVTNTFASSLEVGKGSSKVGVAFNVTTVLFHEDGDVQITDSHQTQVLQNSLKWTTVIDSWPFLDTTNNLQLCIDVMTNGGAVSADTDTDTEEVEMNTETDADIFSFSYDDFEYRIPAFATCRVGEPVTETNVSSVTVVHGSHLQICLTFESCEGLLVHDPFVRFVGVAQEEEEGEEEAETGTGNGGDDRFSSSKIATMVAFFTVGVIVWIGVEGY